MNETATQADVRGYKPRIKNDNYSITTRKKAMLRDREKERNLWAPRNIICLLLLLLKKPSTMGNEMK